MTRIRVLHVVNDLNLHGGAEVTLLRLLESLGEERKTHAVVTLKPLREGNSIGAAIIALGVPMEDLGVSSMSHMPRAFFRLIGLVRSVMPDVLSAWLYYASVLVSLGYPFVGYRPRITWHIRSMPFVEFSEKPSRFIAQRILAFLSHRMRVRIITNSEAARDAHQAIGFSDYSEKWAVIANAVDADMFKPDKDLRQTMRSRLAIPENAVVIGAIGRNVPEKGYPDLFDAFRRLNDFLSPVSFGRLHLVIVGRDLSPNDPGIAASGLQNYQLHLLGARNDVPDIMNALDIFVLPSRSESFPNVLVEAMAAGLPAIATNVGDCRKILNADEYLATGRQGATLCDRILALIQKSGDERAAIGAINRNRIAQTYTRQKMAESFRQEFDR